LARAVAGIDRGEPAAGSLLERGLVAGRGDRPDLGDLRAAVGTPGVEDRIGPADGVLHLRIVAEQSGGTAARLLAAGQIDQRVEPGPRDAGDDRAVVRP